MKVLIFGGFLGSGKTTCLMQLARYVVENSRSDKEIKVMILENEIGEVGIDDAFLRGGGKLEDLVDVCAAERWSPRPAGSAGSTIRNG